MLIMQVQVRLYSQADAGAGSYTLKGVGVSGTVLIPDGVNSMVYAG